MGKNISKETPSEAEGMNFLQESVMTGKEFKGLGLRQTAYLKPTVHDGVKMIAIHAADGTPIAIAEDEQSAVDVILKSQLVPSFLQ